MSATETFAENPQASKVDASPAVARAALAPNKVQQRQFASKDFVALVPNGMDPKELERPDFWSHKAKEFQTGTYLHCYDEGGLWAGIWRVSAAGETWAKTHCIAFGLIPQEVDGDPTPLDKRYKIDHNGSGWRAIFSQTGKVVKDGLKSRAEAEKVIQAEVKKSGM